MQKQTKNIITRDYIEKELRFYNTADIKSSLVLCGVFALIFLPLTVGVIYGILSMFENTLIKIILSVIMGGITSAPIWLNFLGLLCALSERNLLVCGDFDIVTRDVSYKSEEMVHRRMVEYLHFCEFNKISVGHTIFQLSSAGDTFYIVHYKEKKTSNYFIRQKCMSFNNGIFFVNTSKKPPKAFAFGGFCSA
ncbi:MAG: hypothetical protein IKB47_01380 [Clostridia bacterium]|nr:hypothetical protein [Clostridia bacterium]